MILENRHKTQTFSLFPLFFQNRGYTETTPENESTAPPLPTHAATKRGLPPMIYTRPQIAAVIPHPLNGRRELPPMPRFIPRPGQILAMWPRPKMPRAELPRTATPEHISVILERMPLIQELKQRTSEPQTTQENSPNDRNTSAVLCQPATNPRR